MNKECLYLVESEQVYLWLIRRGYDDSNNSFIYSTAGEAGTNS